MARPTTRMGLFPRTRSFGALAVVVLVEVVLFAGHLSERWWKSLVPRHDRQLTAGEGLVVRSDGLGYYAWLRSPLIDGDWSFDNEFDRHNPLGDWVPGARTESGLRSNPWSVGPACLWSVTVVPAHLIVTALWEAGDPWQPDGYILPYQIIVGITTLAASVLGLGFLYGICRHFARPSLAALAAGVMTLGTTIAYYSAMEVSMAHGPAAAILAGLVWYWLRTYGSDRPGRWFLLGLLIGIAAMMRWQLATFVVLPAGEGLFTCRRNGQAGPTGIFKLGALIALAALGSALGFLPQALAWKSVYGQWIVAPMTTSHNWLCPSFWQVLGSVDRGLFYWTPLTLVALLGFLTYRKGAVPRSADAASRNGECLVLLLAAFAIQVYFVSSLLGEEMRLGASFGLRFFTESVVVLAPGMALLLERAPRSCLPLLAGAACLLIVWNFSLIAQYRYALIPADAGAEPWVMLSNTVQLVIRKKARFVAQICLGPVLLWLLVGRGTSEEVGWVKTSQPI